jgi:hypothetical protein
VSRRSALGDGPISGSRAEKSSSQGCSFQPPECDPSKKYAQNIPDGIPRIGVSARNKGLMDFVEAAEDDPETEKEEDLSPESSFRIDLCQRIRKAESEPRIEHRMEDLVDEWKIDSDPDTRLRGKIKNKTVIEDGREKIFGF